MSSRSMSFELTAYAKMLAKATEVPTYLGLLNTSDNDTNIRKNKTNKAFITNVVTELAGGIFYLCVKILQSGPVSDEAARVFNSIVKSSMKVGVKVDQRQFVGIDERIGGIIFDGVGIEEAQEEQVSFFASPSRSADGSSAGSARPSPTKARKPAKIFEAKEESGAESDEEAEIAAAAALAVAKEAKKQKAIAAALKEARAKAKIKAESESEESEAEEEPVVKKPVKKAVVKKPVKKPIKKEEVPAAASAALSPARAPAILPMNEE